MQQRLRKGVAAGITAMVLGAGVMSGASSCGRNGREEAR